MSLDDRKGLENAAGAVLYAISSGLPAKIAALNATESCTVRAMLAGPYAFDADKTLIWTVDKGVAVTVTIPAGTYTATELAAQLDGDATFTGAGSEADVFLAHFLLIRNVAKGQDGKTIIGAGTANSLLGLVAGQTYTYYPLAVPTYYRVQDTDDPPAWDPSVVVWPESQEVVSTENTYQIDVRIRTTNIAYSAGESHTAIRQAMRYGQLVKEIIEGSSSLSSGTDGHRVTSIAPDIESAQDGRQIKGIVDIDIEADVEEE